MHNILDRMQKESDAVRLHNAYHFHFTLLNQVQPYLYAHQ